MARLAGIKFEKDSRGKPRKIIIDLKRWGDKLEDFLDMLEIEINKNEPDLDWEEAKKELLKIHGIKINHKK